MSHKTGFYEGRLGIGLANDGGDGTGNPRFPLDVNGDIRLTGAILKANGEKYLGGLTKMGMNNMTELQNGNIGVGTDAPTVLLDISGNTKISGDLNIIGTLQMNGSTPTYSNWTNAGDDIYRNSNVTIGQGSVNTSYKLYVNGNTYIAGTLQASGTITAPTFSGALSGNATTSTTATNANKVKIQSTNTNASNLYPMLQTAISGTNDCWTQSNGTFYYRANANKLYCTYFQGALIGNASSASQVYVNNGVNANSGHRIIFTSSTSNGNTQLKGDGGLTYNPNTGYVGIGTSSPACGLQVGADSDNNLRSAMKLARTMGFGWREYFPSSGTYGSLSIDNHGTFVIGSNCHIDTNDKIEFNNTHPTSKGPAICMPGNGRAHQGSIIFYTADPGSVTAGNTFKTIGDTPSMNINHNGNVGINLADPSYRLDIKGSTWNSILRIRSGETSGKAVSFNTGTGYFSIKVNNSSSTALVINHSSSFVGIGNNAVPLYPLHVHSTVGASNFTYYAYLNSSDTWSSTSGATHNGVGTTWGTSWGIYCNEAIAAEEAFYVVSDSRIKENIVDVPDNLALQMVRDIPCRYYEYKDKKRGLDKTIGFIAQEIKEVLPMAVSIQTGIIPNEYRVLNNISWNGNKLTTDLQDVSGIKYRFFVSNDPSGNDECEKEVVGNSDNTFTFDTSYNNVFCYGKEVDDFHTISKEKIFALNFSATQELDRKVIALETKNSDLENKVSNLESELAAIKAHLGI